MRYTNSKDRVFFTVFFTILFVFLASNVIASKKAEDTDQSPAAFVVGPEDVLEIAVWKNEDLSKIVRVRPDGMISLPLIGDVAAAGYTPVELQNAIIKKLKRYQDAAVVSVIVNEVNSYRVFIVGEVVRPDTYVLRRKTTVVQAIAMAGGFTQFANKNKIVLIREKDGNGSAKKKVRIYFDDIVDAGEKYDNNLTLLPGDTIFVP